MLVVNLVISMMRVVKTSVCCCGVLAGYVWAYNTQIYYQDIGIDDYTIAWYMSWIPLVFGCLGVTLGGFISDRIVNRLGPYARLGVLIASQVSLTSVLLGQVKSGQVRSYVVLQ